MTHFYYFTFVVVAIGFYLAVTDNKSKFKNEFYNGLNLYQLENELLELLDEISEYHDSSSNFMYVDFENFEAFNKEITNYKAAIINKDYNKVAGLTQEFDNPGRFQILSNDNGWKEEFKVISERFFAVHNAFMNYYNC